MKYKSLIKINVLLILVFIQGCSYLDTEKIGNFTTDSKGHFITTMQIPNTQKESRVDFKIIGYDEIENEIWEYGIDPFYLADVIIPEQILNIILPKGKNGPKVAIELSIIGDEGQVIWNDHMFGRPASSQFH